MPMARVVASAQTVTALVAEQFPQWAHLPIKPVALNGWDNTTFRLGSDKSVRLPNDVGYVPQIDKEHRWLPHLAAHLPLPIPRPLAKGMPGCGFALPWSVYGWIDGDPATATVDDVALAEDLAAFLVALRNAPAANGPAPGAHTADRGGPVRQWDEQTRSTIARLAHVIDTDGALAVWDAAMHAAPWRRRTVWVHGDVTGSNLLTRDGRLCAVIDFGCCAVGDPACDLTPTWTMFNGLSRRRFVEATDCDQATWARARGWALWKAVISIDGNDVDHRARSGHGFGWRRSADEVIAHLIAECA
jgi:aminoglycoside phosphotransferase (APT) family kinase protein